MTYKEKVVSYLKEKGIEIKRVEQEGENKSLVLHVDVSDNRKIKELAPKLEEDLDSALVFSDMFNMNVVIIEANDLDN